MTFQETPEVPTDGVWLITPRRAKKWLEDWNKGNRPKSKSNVSRLVGVLKRGEWVYNGEAIKFSERRLLDGQHFLTAISESGIAAVKMVVTGIDDSAFKGMDRALRRRTSDDFAEMGEVNVTQLAAVIVWLWRLENGKLEVTDMPSTEQAADVLERHPDVRESVTLLGTDWMRKYSGGAVAALTHYIAGGIDREKRDEFFRLLAMGTGMEPGSPVLCLRDRLIENRGAKAKLPQIQKLALYIKAWNAFVCGRSVRFLRWRQEGDAKEPFPSFLPRKSIRVTP